MSVILPPYVWLPNEFMLSHSSMTAHETCEKKFFLRKFFPTPKSKDEGVAAGVGKALHAGFQTWVKTNSETAAVAAMMFEYPIKECPWDNDSRSLEAAYMTLLEMIKSPIMQEYEIVKVSVRGQEKDAIEFPFKIRLADTFLDARKAIPISYIGYIDLILYHRVTGTYVVVDIKTHQDNRHDLSGTYRYDAQCLPYALMLEHVLGHNIQNGLKVRYMSVYIDLKEPKIKYYDFYKTYDEVQQWVHTLMLRVHQIKYSFDNNFWPRTVSGRTCNPRYGACWALDICELDDPQRIYKQLFADTPPEKVSDTRGEEFDPWADFTLKVAA